METQKTILVSNFAECCKNWKAGNNHLTDGKITLKKIESNRTSSQTIYKCYIGSEVFSGTSWQCFTRAFGYPQPKKQEKEQKNEAVKVTTIRRKNCMKVTTKISKRDITAEAVGAVRKFSQICNSYGIVLQPAELEKLIKRETYKVTLKYLKAHNEVMHNNKVREGIMDKIDEYTEQIKDLKERVNTAVEAGDFERAKTLTDTRVQLEEKRNELSKKLM